MRTATQVGALHLQRNCLADCLLWQRYYTRLVEAESRVVSSPTKPKFNFRMLGVTCSLGGNKRRSPHGLLTLTVCTHTLRPLLHTTTTTTTTMQRTTAGPRPHAAGCSGRCAPAMPEPARRCRLATPRGAGSHRRLAGRPSAVAHSAEPGSPGTMRLECVDYATLLQPTDPRALDATIDKARAQGPVVDRRDLPSEETIRMQRVSSMWLLWLVVQVGAQRTRRGTPGVRCAVYWVVEPLGWQGNMLTRRKHVLSSLPRSQALGLHGVGAIVVCGVPGILELRRALLPLASQFAVGGWVATALLLRMLMHCRWRAPCAQGQLLTGTAVETVTDMDDLSAISERANVCCGAGLVQTGRTVWKPWIFMASPPFK